MKKRGFFLYRTLGIFLSIALSLPSSTFALRPQEPSEGPVGDEIKAALFAGAKDRITRQLSRILNPAFSAGLEETSQLLRGLRERLQARGIQFEWHETVETDPALLPEEVRFHLNESAIQEAVTKGSDPIPIGWGLELQVSGQTARLHMPPAGADKPHSDYAGFADYLHQLARQVNAERILLDKEGVFYRKHGQTAGASRFEGVFLPPGLFQFLRDRGLTLTLLVDPSHQQAWENLRWVLDPRTLMRNIPLEMESPTVPSRMEVIRGPAAGGDSRELLPLIGYVGAVDQQPSADRLIARSFIIRSWVYQPDIIPIGRGRYRIPLAKYPPQHPTRQFLNLLTQNNLRGIGFQGGNVLALLRGRVPRDHDGVLVVSEMEAKQIPYGDEDEAETSALQEYLTRKATPLAQAIGVDDVRALYPLMAAEAGIPPAVFNDRTVEIWSYPVYETTGERIAETTLTLNADRLVLLPEWDNPALDTAVLLDPYDALLDLESGHAKLVGTSAALGESSSHSVWTVFRILRRMGIESMDFNPTQAADQADLALIRGTVREWKPVSDKKETMTLRRLMEAELTKLFAQSYPKTYEALNLLQSFGLTEALRRFGIDDNRIHQLLERVARRVGKAQNTGQKQAGLEETILAPAEIGFDVKGEDTLELQNANVRAILEHLRRQGILNPADSHVVNVGSRERVLVLPPPWNWVENWDPRATVEDQAAAQRLGTSIQPVDIGLIASAARKFPVSPSNYSRMPNALILYRMGAFIPLYNDPAQFYRDLWQATRPGGIVVIANPSMSNVITAVHEVEQMYRDMCAAIDPSVPAGVWVVSPDGTFKRALAIAIRKPVAASAGLEELLSIRQAVREILAASGHGISAVYFPIPYDEEIPLQRLVHGAAIEPKVRDVARTANADWVSLVREGDVLLVEAAPSAPNQPWWIWNVRRRLERYQELTSVDDLRDWVPQTAQIEELLAASPPADQAVAVLGRFRDELAARYQRRPSPPAGSLSFEGFFVQRALAVLDDAVSDASAGVIEQRLRSVFAGHPDPHFLENRVRYGLPESQWEALLHNRQRVEIILGAGRIRFEGTGNRLEPFSQFLADRLAYHATLMQLPFLPIVDIRFFDRVQAIAPARLGETPSEAIFIRNGPYNYSVAIDAGLIPVPGQEASPERLQAFFDAVDAEILHLVTYMARDLRSSVEELIADHLAHEYMQGVIEATEHLQQRLNQLLDSPVVDLEGALREESVPMDPIHRIGVTLSLRALQTMRRWAAEARQRNLSALQLRQEAASWIRSYIQLFSLIEYPAAAPAIEVLAPIYEFIGLQWLLQLQTAQPAGSADLLAQSIARIQASNIARFLETHRAVAESAGIDVGQFLDWHSRALQAAGSAAAAQETASLLSQLHDILTRMRRTVFTRMLEEARAIETSARAILAIDTPQELAYRAQEAVGGLEEPPYLVDLPGYRGPVAVVGKVGGTGIRLQAAVVGGILKGTEITGPTLLNPAGEPQEQILDRQVDQICQVIDRFGANNVMYVHLSYPGYFDENMILTRDQENIPFMKSGLDIAAALEFRLNATYPRSAALGPIRVIIVHDGTGGANGERSAFGTFPNASDLFFIAPGTGIATRGIINGQPFTGGAQVQYLANEAPNYLTFAGDPDNPDYEFVMVKTKGENPPADVPTLANGDPNPFFGKETLEQRTAGPGIARYAVALAASGQFDQAAVVDPLIAMSPDNDINKITAKILGVAANQGNPLAVKAVRERGRELGVGLAVMLVEFHRNWPEFAWPPHIVLGGGVAQIGDLYLEAVKEGFRDRLNRYATEGSVPDLPDTEEFVSRIEASAIKDSDARELLAGLPTQIQADGHAAKLAGVPSAGLEEGRKIFKSMEEFSLWYGAALREQGLIPQMQTFLQQGAASVQVIPAIRAPVDSTAVMVYVHSSDQPAWESAVGSHLQSSSFEKVEFFVTDYPANGSLLQPPVVVIQQEGVALPAQPAGKPPILLLRDLSALSTVSPGFIYAVSIDSALAGQTLGPFIGVLTFQDSKGQWLHAVFA
ncbi:MAG: hypothetical protein NC819_02600 [Candidatus Omnitrophica bacterium]|nr:hypothetical protein [Candidatus Omnitrophota bacterium]